MVENDVPNEWKQKFNEIRGHSAKTKSAAKRGPGGGGGPHPQKGSYSAAAPRAVGGGGVALGAVPSRKKDAKHRAEKKARKLKMKMKIDADAKEFLCRAEEKGIIGIKLETWGVRPLKDGWQPQPVIQLTIPEGVKSATLWSWISELEYGKPWGYDLTISNGRIYIFFLADPQPLSAPPTTGSGGGGTLKASPPLTFASGAVTLLPVRANAGGGGGGALLHFVDPRTNVRIDIKDAATYVHNAVVAKTGKAPVMSLLGAHGQ